MLPFQRKPSSPTVTWWVVPCHSRTRMVPLRGSGPSKLPLRFDRRAEHVIKQPIELPGDRFGEAALAAFLPRIGNAERENVTTKRSRRSLPKLLGPKRPQFAKRQPIEAMNSGRGVARAIVYPARSRWQPRR